MRPDKLAYFLVGLFVIVAISGLVVVLALLGGRGADTVNYHTKYENVAGLKFGTPVYFEGFRAGQIERISPIAGGTRTIFEVEISVLEELSIPSDSEVQIVQPNLLSGRALSIAAGKAKTDIETDGEIRPGETAGLAALPGLVGAGNELIRDASVLMSEATAAMAQINEFVTHDLGRIASRYEELPVSLRGNIDVVTADLRRTIDNFDAIALRANELISQDTADRIDQTVDNIATLSGRLEETSRGLSTISDNVTVITDQLRTMIVDNEADIEGTIVDLRYTMETIANRIDAMTYNLEGTSQNMYEFSRQIRLNPGLLLGGSAQSETTGAGNDQ
jgi:phospholipid/cholesterol/gamma-HCH transport system substrate-binding protein